MHLPFPTTQQLQKSLGTWYKTAEAILELIRISIEENCKNVDVAIIRDPAARRNEIQEILIIDDGDGMNEAVLKESLMTYRHRGCTTPSRSLLSFSQTLKFEIYSRKDNKLIFHYMDLDDVS